MNTDGSTTMVADLSQFIKSHPVANPNPGDFEPDGTWYSMVGVFGALFAIEPNHGELDVISPGIGISRVADISRIQGHIVPTAFAVSKRFPTAIHAISGGDLPRGTRTLLEFQAG